MEVKQYLIDRYRRYCNGLEDLIKNVPGDSLEWTPCEATMPIGALVNHVVESADFPQQVLERDFPSEEEFYERTSTVEDRSAAPEEALEKLAEVSERNLQALREASEADFAAQVEHPVFGGGSAGATMLFMFEHLTSHRHQLFHYLKQLGHHELGTACLYGFPRQ